MSWIKYVAKAIVAGVTTFAAGVAPFLVNGGTFADISQGQWVTIIALTVVAVAGVFGISNGPKPT
jgi:hypothetical protein